MGKLYLSQRKSIRLTGYDYSCSGYYFITICTYDRQNLFGKIIDSEMFLNEYGKIVHNEWLKSEEIRKEIKIDRFIVMPNHFHAILAIDRPSVVGPYGNTAERGNTAGMVQGYARTAGKECTVTNNVQKIGMGVLPEKRTYDHTSLQSPSKNTGAMIRGFKSTVTAKINIMRSTPNNPVWQPKYFDHIIRNEHELQKIREYIITNPDKWQKDKYFI